MGRQIIFGNKKIDRLSEILNKSKSEKIFLITGKNSFENLYNINSIKKQLQGFEIFHYNDFDVNPNFKDIIKGIDQVQRYKPDIIIGIGGGSVLDTAKLLSVLPISEKKINKVFIQKEVLTKKSFPLMLIPTTAGSGSECTHFAVAYIGQNKYSIASNFMLPEYSIIDPECTFTMPKYLTAVTALDAFSQAIESFWARNANDESMDYAAESIKLNIRCFEKVITNPDLESRELMLKASFLAGKAINISKTTAPHALSYFLTKNFNLAHGHAVALTLGSFFIFNGKENAHRNLLNLSINEYAIKMDKLLKLIRVSCSEDAARLINQRLVFSGLETKLSKIGFKSIVDVNNMCESVNLERLDNNPILITKNEMAELLKGIY